MARKRHPRAATKRNTDTNQSDNRPPSLLTVTPDPWLDRSLGFVGDLYDATIERLVDEQLDALAQGRRWPEPSEPAPPPSTSQRLRGEPPPRRVRRSQRGTPSRDSHAAIVRGMSGDQQTAHERLVTALRARLGDIQASWPHVMEGCAAVAKLRAVLPRVRVSASALGEAIAHIEALEAWIALIAPSYCRSPEDLWLPLAGDYLDDDEISQILSPAAYERDRQAALAALRTRRRALVKRLAAEGRALAARTARGRGRLA